MYISIYFFYNFVLFHNLTEMLWSRREKMSMISNICSQYGTFPQSIIAILLIRTVIKEIGEMTCLGGGNMWAVASTYKMSSTLLSLGDLSQWFCCPKSCFQNGHFPKTGAHLLLQGSNPPDILCLSAPSTFFVTTSPRQVPRLLPAQTYPLPLVSYWILLGQIFIN